MAAYGCIPSVTGWTVHNNTRQVSDSFLFVSIRRFSFQGYNEVINCNPDGVLTIFSSLGQELVLISQNKCDK